MFFAKLGRLIAVLALVFGVLRVLIGFYVASIEPIEARQAATARYIGSKTSGQAIDQGMYMILFSVALGMLASIARKRLE